MISLGDFKVGDTFIFDATIKDKTAQPLINAVGKLKSQVRDSDDVLIDELSITDLTLGKYAFSCADTTKWPLGNLFLDIQLTDKGVISSSDTFTLTVIKDVTR